MSDTQRRSSSVTYVCSRTPSKQDETQGIKIDDDEDIQITLAPYIQTYLAHRSQKLTCCGVALPIPFERASRSSWWNPRFDSEILEGQYKRSAFAQIRLRFRYALLYILVVSISWFIYFFYKGLCSEFIEWKTPCIILIMITISIMSFLFFTYTDIYRSHITLTSSIVAFILCSLSLCCSLIMPKSFSTFDNNILANVSPVGQLTFCIEILLLIYTVIPLPLYICVTFSTVYSVVFELLVHFLNDQYIRPRQSDITVRILMQFCVHLIGIHIFIMTNVRMRGTFMKVGQSLLVRRQLEMEKQLKEKMIHSVMPPKVADWLMSETGEFEQDIDVTNKTAIPRNSNPGASDLKSLFRPFNMNCMENVSILFADIVGFTKMSSNKTADELVGILNDLFERFDDLCLLNDCEKISTLGDCYYCVSGCPEPKNDHAKCCVEMGLGMIQAIKQFDTERKEGVNMRVGIHTGTVLCGIVGTRRFKFDVWSNDVNLANRMESTGKPGRVHISEKTSMFLENLYILEDGDVVNELKTYFIIGRQSDLTTLEPECDPCIQLIISPAVSPQLISPQNRPRLLTCGNNLKPELYNPNQLSPYSYRIKASSLPSILDSDTENEGEAKIRPNQEVSKSPTSVSSCGKYSSRLKNWKVPKFLFKTDTVDQTYSNIENPQKSPIVKKEDNHLSNGYQQIPMIIESQPNCLKVEQSVRGSICNGSDSLQPSIDTKNDILDIKFYISQSRSDIGQFEKSPLEFVRSGSCKTNRSRESSPNDISNGIDRSGSCKSQYGKSVNMNSSPKERGRGSTVDSKVESDSLEIPGSGLDDRLSLCISINSRKDSGIRSTSRRSSIQQQIFALNRQPELPQEELLQHRVSGYYTSSQSTLNSSIPQYTSRLPPPLSDHLGACLQKLRKQSDLQLIRCVQDNTSSERSYFIKPPLSPFTLFFQSYEMEMEYRRNVHTITELPEESVPTLATARFNTYLDVLVSAIIFLTISLSLFLLYNFNKLWIGVFIIFLIIQACAIFLCVRQILKFSENIFKIFSKWYRWHTVGAVLVSIPIVSILINFSCSNNDNKLSDYLYNFFILIGLVHFCNFTQLNCWMKNILATFYTAIFFILIFTSHCPAIKKIQSLQHSISHAQNISLQYNFLQTILKLQSKQKTPPHISLSSTFNNISFQDSTVTDTINKLNTTNTSTPILNSTVTPDNNTFHDIIDTNMISQSYQITESNYHIARLYKSEIFIDIILLLLLVWFLNREFEISYRLSFHSNIVANRDKARVQSMKNQADWLLHNIIPKHVADQLKNTAKYSENHKDVGIIFASIVNFNEMYDESYMGGKEFLRVLNELIGDFDELLTQPEFRTVEKIKTIGSTFMAASGLNPETRKENSNPYNHLYALMDFATAMQKVIDDFNRDLLGFNLILRVGYNYGEVTAGVIGTSKLYYDIWGDAVNIASRMDSTGVNGRIQIGSACLEVLECKYEFEHRGCVYVKGKDNMDVYLLIRKKEEGND